MSETVMIDSPGIAVMEPDGLEPDAYGTVVPLDVGEGDRVEDSGDGAEGVDAEVETVVADVDEGSTPGETAVEQEGASDGPKIQRYFVAGQRQQAKHLDSTLAAEEFRSQTKYIKDGTCILKFWRGSFYGWTGGAYRAISNEEMGVLVDNYLQGFVNYLNNGTVKNVVGRLKAQAAISSRLNPPVWLPTENAKTPRWPANEVVVAKNGIFHLPTLAEQLESGELFDVERCRMDLTPNLFTLNALDFPIDLNAPEPVQFFKFLGELFPDDAEGIAYLQEWFGYLLYQLPTSVVIRSHFLASWQPWKSGVTQIHRLT